jgi:hypothetical protein
MISPEITYSKHMMLFLDEPRSDSCVVEQGRPRWEKWKKNYLKLLIHEGGKGVLVGFGLHLRRKVVAVMDLPARRKQQLDGGREWREAFGKGMGERFAKNPDGDGD